MAVGRDILKKIKSIQNTQKITRAMEMVAASKMRRAQERMSAARPYAEKIHNVIGHLHHAHPEYKHPFVVEREAKNVGIVLVTTDRGLCGGLNANAMRTTLEAMRGWDEKGLGISMSTIGAKGLGFFRRLGANILSEATHLGDTPRFEDLIGAIKVMLDAYTNADVDCLYIVYSRFVNTMTQRPALQQLLPLPGTDEEELKHHWDYIYEPDAEEVLEDLLRRYIEALVYHAVVENLACEQSARMVAMKSASDNAGKLIDEFTLKYNKARQAAITQEISEIVGGAGAV
ncbi:MAG: F0F1 ATP synthase subunit gamma [Gammaproteobacteria bacterium]|nr:F0F1 ATP synthase subunit gamma [Gammaproteobacteria bacterium]